MHSRQYARKRDLNRPLFVGRLLDNFETPVYVYFECRPDAFRRPPDCLSRPG